MFFVIQQTTHRSIGGFVPYPMGEFLQRKMIELENNAIGIV